MSADASHSPDMLRPFSRPTHRGFLEDIRWMAEDFRRWFSSRRVCRQRATVFDDQGQFSVNCQGAAANYFAVAGVSANFGGSVSSPDSVLFPLPQRFFRPLHSRAQRLHRPLQGSPCFRRIRDGFLDFIKVESSD